MTETIEAAVLAVLKEYREELTMQQIKLIAYEVSRRVVRDLATSASQ